MLGLPVQLRNADDTGIRSWRWEILDQPSVVAPVQLSNPVAPNPVFTPDQPGTYLLQLTVNEGRKGEVQRILVAIRDAGGRRIPAAGENREANWLDATGEPNPRGWQPDIRGLLSQTSGTLGTDDMVPNSTTAATRLRNHQLLQEKLDTIAAAGGGKLEIGAGVFHVDTDTQGPLLYPQNITVCGLNRMVSRIQGNGGVAVFQPERGTAFNFDISGRTLNVLFENMGIWNSDRAASGGVCLDARQVSNSDFRFLDLRQSETGLLVENVAYANEFASLQANNVDVAFAARNGCNENDFVNCRASGIDIGFLFEDGSDAAINAITIDRCTVETFTDAAIRVDHADLAPNNFDNFRIHNCRFTNGIYGFDFVEQGSGELTNFIITNTLPDGLTTLLEWEIGGQFFASGHAAVAIAMRGARNFLMIHGGKLWPVRFGYYSDVESNSNLLAYTNVANQVAIRNGGDSVNADISANDITSATNGAGTERVNFNRLRVSGPTAHVSGDWAASGFGATPTITPDSVDGRGSVSVQASAAPSANPTLTLTFQDGSWPTAPHVQCSRADSLATAGEWRATSRTTTTITFTFIGTPVNGETYILDYQVVG